MAILDLTYGDLDDIIILQRESDFVDGWAKNILLKSLDDANYVGFGYFEHLKLVGYICFNCVYGSVDLDMLLVHKDFRRKGIAKALIERMEKHILDNKWKLLEKGKDKLPVFLEVRESNISAINLYSSFNYEKISLRKKYYMDGENAVIMKKEI